MATWRLIGVWWTCIKITVIFVNLSLWDLRGYEESRQFWRLMIRLLIKISSSVSSRRGLDIRRILFHILGSCFKVSLSVEMRSLSSHEISRNIRRYSWFILLSNSWFSSIVIIGPRNWSLIILIFDLGWFFLLLLWSPISSSIFWKQESLFKIRSYRRLICSGLPLFSLFVSLIFAHYWRCEIGRHCIWCLLSLPKWLNISIIALCSWI